VDDDATIIAAIAAGDLDGLAAALERYAAALYEYCYALAPTAAAEVVRDTFVLAWCRADSLDPARLFAWLQVVAGNECLRVTLTEGTAGAPAEPAPAPQLPSALPGEILGACADDTAAGQAYRAGLVDRVGPFGPDGFPTMVPPRRTRRLRVPGDRPERARRQRRTVAAFAAAVLLIAGVPVAATLLAGRPASAPHHAAAGASGQVTDVAPTTGADLPSIPAEPNPASGSGQPGSPSAPATGSARPTVAKIRPPATHDGLPAPAISAPATHGSPPAPSPSVVPVAVVTSTAPPAPGILTVDKVQLHLVCVKGGDSVRTFALTAQGGPVAHYSIAIPPGLPGSLTVLPGSGSLASGQSATITVTAATTVPFATTLTVYPGGTVITVNVKANPQHAD
jgi:hypothetical protein